MNYSVGVFADESMREEAIAAAKEALKSVAEQYHCRFELRAEGNPSVAQGKNPITENLENTKNEPKDRGISFGGEIEI